MPRVAGVRERRHQPFYDCLIRTDVNPSPIIQPTTQLFGNANVGNTALTNLQVAGQLASDQTYILLSLRCYLYFNGTDRRVLYLGTSSQLYWQLTVGDKPAFNAPTWYFPQGGGIWGADSSSTTSSVFTNGTPEQTAILKLAKPIAVPVRQNFSVAGTWYQLGTTDYRNGATSINTATAERIIMFMLDGVQTRDVQ